MRGNPAPRVRGWREVTVIGCRRQRGGATCRWRHHRRQGPWGCAVRRRAHLLPCLLAAVVERRERGGGVEVARQAGARRQVAAGRGVASDCCHGGRGRRRAARQTIRQRGEVCSRIQGKHVQWPPGCTGEARHETAGEAREGELGERAETR